MDMEVSEECNRCKGHGNYHQCVYRANTCRGKRPVPLSEEYDNTDYY